MSHESNTHYNESMQELQTASITLSRGTLERLQYAYNDLLPDELEQVEEALKAFRINDEIEVVKEVFAPKGTTSAPRKPFTT